MLSAAPIVGAAIQPRPKVKLAQVSPPERTLPTSGDGVRSHATRRGNAAPPQLVDGMQPPFHTPQMTNCQPAPCQTPMTTITANMHTRTGQPDTGHPSSPAPPLRRERNEDVVAHPRCQRHVPALPEVEHVGRPVRLGEILRHTQAEQQNRSRSRCRSIRSIVVHLECCRRPWRPDTCPPCTTGRGERSASANTITGSRSRSS